VKTTVSLARYFTETSTAARGRATAFYYSRTENAILVNSETTGSGQRAHCYSQTELGTRANSGLGYPTDVARSKTAKGCFTRENLIRTSKLVTALRPSQMARSTKVNSKIMSKRVMVYLPGKIAQSMKGISPMVNFGFFGLNWVRVNEWTRLV
jgi:hypothetical protein